MNKAPIVYTVKAPNGDHLVLTTGNPDKLIAVKRQRITALALVKLINRTGVIPSFLLK